MAHPAHTLFFPHPHNNHKAKILKPLSLIVLMGLYIMGRSVIDISVALHPGVLGYVSQIDPDKIVEYTNNERLNAGLEIVKVNPELNQAALAKVAHMFANNYWAHNAPDGTEPWLFITQAGYKYQYAGENLAKDFSNSKDIVKAWMASPTHKANLLDSRYGDIGIAVMDGYINGIETTIVVQMFGTAPKTISRVASTSITKSVIANEEIQETQPLYKELQNTQQKIYPVGGASPMDLSRVWSLAFVTLILFALAIDWLFVYRYNIIRISGKTWAHITFFASLGAILLIIRQGIIL